MEKEFKEEFDDNEFYQNLKNNKENKENAEKFNYLIVEAIDEDQLKIFKQIIKKF